MKNKHTTHGWKPRKYVWLHVCFLSPFEMVASWVVFSLSLVLSQSLCLSFSVCVDKSVHWMSNVKLSFYTNLSVRLTWHLLLSLTMELILKWAIPTTVTSDSRTIHEISKHFPWKFLQQIILTFQWTAFRICWCCYFFVAGTTSKHHQVDIGCMCGNVANKM